MTESRKNPYVGPRPFESDETLYGRDRETRALLDLLIAERIVLLHSPSGAGKTSLLQAKLLPRLGKHRFSVPPIVRVHRVSSYGAGNRYMYSVLSSLEDGIKGERLNEAELSSLSLEQYLERRAGRFGEANRLALVFDQFEQVLSLDATDGTAKEAFFAQLGQALVDQQRWALFAIREEYIGRLAPYALSLPTQLRTTFRLDLLNKQAARSAIQDPLLVQHVKFTDSAAEKLLEDLARVQVQQPDGTMAMQPGQYIEPVQLQVVCRRLWEALDPSASLIAETNISEVGSVDDALAEYYAESVRKAVEGSKESERTIREWFKRQLITAQGVRSQVLKDPDGSGGLRDPAIQFFVEAHIVREEVSRGATWYELAHDRLIKPIHDDNLRWEEANRSPLGRQADLWDRQKRDTGYLLGGQALADVEAWARSHPDELGPVENDFLQASQEEHTRVERERQHQQEILQWAIELRRRAIIATIIGAAALLALLGAIYFFLDAREHARISDARRLGAQSAAFKDRQFDLALLIGVEAFRQDDNPEVRGNLLDALASHPQLKTYLSGQTDVVWSVAFSPDGKTVALGDANYKIILWDVSTGKPSGPALEGHKNTVTSLAFSPDGKTLASGSADSTVGLWDVNTRQPTGPRLEGHKNVVWRVTYSPDGKLLASSSSDYSIILWNTETQQRVGSPLKGHTDIVYDVAFSPDGKTLASGSNDKTIIFWDVATQQRIGAPLKGHDKTVYSVAFSPNGRTLASGSDDQTILLWDVATQQPIHPPLTGHTDAVRSLTFTPDGKFLISGSHDGTIRRWDMSSVHAIEPPLTGHTGNVYSVAASPDGKMLASGGADQTGILWDLTGVEHISSPLAGQTGIVDRVAYDREGRLVGARRLAKTITLWDLTRNQSIGSLTGHDGNVVSTAFSNDGRTLVSESDLDMSIRLWDVSTNQPISSIEMDKDVFKDTFINSLATGGDNKVAAGTDNGSVFLWDARTRQVIHSWPGKGSPITSMAFSSDGNILAVGSADSTIRLWDVKSERSINDLRLPGRSKVASIAISPDGKSFVSGQENGAIILWGQTPEWQAIGLPITRDRLSVNSLSFSPDGRRLASLRAGGTIILWDLDAQSWLREACRIANRPLSQAEWVQYINPDSSTYRETATCPF